MNSFSEHRLLPLYIDPTQIKKVSTRGQVVNATPTPVVSTPQTAPLPVEYGGGSVTYTGNVKPGQDTPGGIPKIDTTQNLGYTGGMTLEQAQKANQDYYAKYGSNDPALQAALYNLENPGAAEESMRQMANLKAPNPTYVPDNYTTSDGKYIDYKAEADKAYAAAYAQPGFLEDKLKAGQKAVENYYAQVRADQEKQQQYSTAQRAVMASNAAGAESNIGKTSNATNSSQPTPVNPVSAFGAKNLAHRLAMLPDRQTFIEQKRAEGLSDKQIRDLIATLPPDQTGGVTPPIPPAASTNSGSSTSSTTKTSSASTDGSVTSTATPIVNPQASLLRTIAATETDPITKAILETQASSIEAEGTIQDPLSQAAYIEKYGDSLTAPEDAIAEILRAARRSAEKTQDSKKAFLDSQFERNDKFLAAQQENINNQLTFANDKAVRDQAETNKKTLDEQTIVLALSGGFGSADGNRELSTIRQKGEEAIINLNKEFGFKKTDVSLNFTQMHNEAYDNYRTAWLDATDKFETKVADIDVQGISNQGAKKSALANAYKTYVSDIKEARKTAASELGKALEYVQVQSNLLRNEKRSQEKDGWNQMEWAAKTYGSETPQAIIDSIQKQLPGVDVKGTLTAMTLAEMKQKKISSGGGSSSLLFQPYEMKSGGQIPGFEDYAARRKQEILTSLKKDENLTIEEANSRLKEMTSDGALRKEYEAKVTATNQYNPTEIINRFVMKAGTLPDKNRQYAEKQINDALARGDYKFASELVDNTGDDVPATQANDFTQALNSRYNIAKMKNLFDDIGITYPGVGLVRNLNPLDDKVVQYNQNLTQTIPGLARGIFKEVGVLTDADIARYTNSIADPNLTQEQARTAFNDLMQRIDVSMQNQINVWDAGRKAVGGFRQLYEAEPLGLDDGNTSIDDYLNNLP